MKVARTEAELKSAWLVAIFTAYWQDALMSTSTQKGQLFRSPLAVLTELTFEETPAVYLTK